MRQPPSPWPRPSTLASPPPASASGSINASSTLATSGTTTSQPPANPAACCCPCSRRAGAYPNGRAMKPTAPRPSSRCCSKAISPRRLHRLLPAGRARRSRWIPPIPPTQPGTISAPPSAPPALALCPRARNVLPTSAMLHRPFSSAAAKQRTADLAGNNFNQGTVGPVQNCCYGRLLLSEYVLSEYVITVVFGPSQNHGHKISAAA